MNKKNMRRRNWRKNDGEKELKRTGRGGVSGGKGERTA